MVSFPTYAVSLMKCFIETLSGQAIKAVTTFSTNLTWEDWEGEKLMERGGGWSVGWGLALWGAEGENSVLSEGQSRIKSKCRLFH